MPDFAHHSEGLPNQCPYCGCAIRFPPVGGIGCVVCPQCSGVSWFGENGIVEPLPNSIAEEISRLRLPIVNDFNIAVSIPESVARENSILPLARTPDGVIVAMAAPVNFELIEKLQFILNTRVWFVSVPRNWNDSHISQLYRQWQAERYLLLMLEDNAERNERFERTLKLLAPQLELRCWRSAHAMIEEVEPYLELAALLSLDHDLEPLEGEEDPGEGVAVAKYLVSQPLKRPVIIHSSNSERARWMAGDFELADWPYWRVVPYGDDWIETHWRQVVGEILATLPRT